MNKSLILALVLSLGLVACGPIEETARDSIAAAKGAIQEAQTAYIPICIETGTNPSDPACFLINNAIDINDLAIDALLTYCGFEIDNTTTSEPPLTCNPQSDKKALLLTALKNLNRIIADVRKLVSGF